MKDSIKKMDVVTVTLVVVLLKSRSFPQDERCQKIDVSRGGGSDCKTTG